MSFRYNDELLLAERDRDEASRQFGKIAFALDHPQLRETFEKYDAIANRCKGGSRKLGLAAVSLTALALILAAWEPVLHDLLPHEGFWSNSPKVLAVVAGIAGIIAGAIGISGLLYGKKKEEWLQARLVTERLRQWHWQHYVAELPRLVAAARFGDSAGFREDRDTKFEAFRSEFVEQVSAELPRYVDPRLSGTYASAARLLWCRPDWTKPAAELPSLDDPCFKEVCVAYDTFRIRGQIQYTTYKLKEENERFLTHAQVQARRLGNLALICVIGILLLHALVLVGVLGDIEWARSKVVHATAITAAILALAGRTLEEGLQPRRETDRLRTYLQQLEVAKERFWAAESSEERLNAMREIEAASFYEMVSFLRTAHESRFVM